MYGITSCVVQDTTAGYSTRYCKIWRNFSAMFHGSYGGCLPDSSKPDSPKLGLGFRVRVSANRDWTLRRENIDTLPHVRETGFKSSFIDYMLLTISLIYSSFINHHSNCSMNECVNFYCIVWLCLLCVFLYLYVFNAAIGLHRCNIIDKIELSFLLGAKYRSQCFRFRVIGKIK